MSVTFAHEEYADM